jgi:DNA-binding YbaB/EbfC family protein
MPNMDEIMKMAQNAQAELERATNNLDKVEVEGISGGGLIRIRCSAKGRIIAVNIDESLLQPSEKQMLEDLIAAAFNDARAKADQAASAEMSKVTSGLPLPPGFKMPF